MPRGRYTRLPIMTWISEQNNTLVGLKKQHGHSPPPCPASASSTGLVMGPPVAWERGYPADSSVPHSGGQWQGPTWHSLTSLVQAGKGLEVASVAQGLQLLVRAASQEPDEVETMQLEFQGAVQLQQMLPV